MRIVEESQVAALQLGENDTVDDWPVNTVLDKGRSCARLWKADVDRSSTDYRLATASTRTGNSTVLHRLPVMRKVGLNEERYGYEANAR